MIKNLIKILTIFIMIAGLNCGLNAEDEFKGLPAGLLTFSTKVPIELNDANAQVLLSSNSLEAIRNEQIIREKTFPWGKLFLATIGILFFIALYNIPRTSTEALPMKIKTAQDKAKEKLDLLKISDSNEGDKEFYRKLSDILRSYIEDRYQIKALKKTTEEFLASIQKDPLPIQFPEKTLSQFLTLSDRVKFAKTNPTSDERSLGYETVKKFVQQ